MGAIDIIKINSIVLIISYLFIGTTIFYNKDSKYKFSEYKYLKNNKYWFFKHFWTPFIPYSNFLLKRKSKIIKSNNLELNNADYSLYFINGIITSQKYAKYIRKYIEYIFDHQCIIFYNETRSLLVDTIEVTLFSLFNIMTKFMKVIERTIINDLKINKKVILICYSEGTIMFSNILTNMIRKKYKINYSNLEIYSIGGFASFNHTFKNNKPYIEIFYNTKDIITFINIKKKNKNIKVINSSNYGYHSLITDYLFKIENKLYENTRLNSYIKFQ
jgi:hypothetical protein